MYATKHPSDGLICRFTFRFHKVGNISRGNSVNEFSKRPPSRRNFDELSDSVAKEIASIDSSTKCLQRWPCAPQAGALVWIRYAGNVSCGRLVHCMPQLNMYTVRPNDGGLTRFVTRGIEDILPVTEINSPLHPPSEADWEEEANCTQPPLSCAQESRCVTLDSGNSQRLSSLHSPLYIDACSVFSPRHISTEETAPSNFHAPSFTGFLSNSPVSFTLSPTINHSDPGDTMPQKYDEEFPRFTTSKYRSPGTPHSAPVVYPIGSAHHCWDCGEALDSSCTGNSPCSRCERDEYCCATVCGPNGTSSLPVVSIAVASVVDAMRKLVDTRMNTTDVRITAKNDQNVFLKSLNETLNRLLTLGTTSDPSLVDATSAKTHVNFSPKVSSQSSSSRPSMDALTAALLASPSQCESDAVCSLVSDRGNGDSFRNFLTESIIHSFTHASVPSPNRNLNLPETLTCCNVTSNENTSTATPMATGASHSKTFVSPLSGKPCDFENLPLLVNSNENTKHPNPNMQDPSHPVSTVDILSECQVPLILQALQQLCTCHGSSNTRVSFLLENLRGLLTVLVDPTEACRDLANAVVSSAPTFASVGTQSDQLDIPCDIEQTAYGHDMNTNLSCNPTIIRSGKADVRWSNEATDISLGSKLGKESFGATSLSVLSENVMSKSTLGKRPSPSSVYSSNLSQLDDPPSVKPFRSVSDSKSKVTFLSRSVARPAPPGRRKQRALSESTNSTSVTELLLSTGPKTHPFPLKSDVKKCRKVYGIENRNQWCNQCRWKKACRRFPDVSCGQSTTASSAASSSIPCAPISTLSFESQMGSIPVASNLNTLSVCTPLTQSIHSLYGPESPPTSATFTSNSNHLSLRSSTSS